MTRVAEHVCNLLIERRGDVEYNGVRVPLVSSARSAEFMGSLLTIGLVSLERTAPGVLDWVRMEECPRALMILTDYAIDAAPFLDEEGLVINGPEVVAHAADLKRRFLDPEIRPEFLREIAVFAQFEMDAREAPARSGPLAGGREG